VARKGAALPDLDAYLARWASLHGGYDPRGSRLVGWWLRAAYECARPLARARVSPATVTLTGAVVAIGAALAARAGWLWVALALVLVSSLADNLDGAVAVITDRASSFGAVLDSACDRVADLAYVSVLYWAGASAWVCVTGAAVMFLHEYVRARATAVGMTDIGIITVWERPSRVAVTAMFLLGAALWSRSPAVSHRWAEAGGWVWVLVGIAGLVQLTVVVRRRLRAT
jgi:CDP-diacylglycerol--glycerol-3-phosphate 3-phosphatidyltransferase